MTKSAKYAEKYWFALGYHHKRIDNIQKLDNVVIESYKEFCNIDITKEYSAGIDSAEKDMKAGID